MKSYDLFGEIEEDDEEIVIDNFPGVAGSSSSSGTRGSTGPRSPGANGGVALPRKSGNPSPGRDSGGMVSPGSPYLLSAGGADSSIRSPFSRDGKASLFREVVIDRNGRPRQAGADPGMEEMVLELKKAAEEDLYIFAKGVLNRHFLTDNLHRPVCEFLQQCPPVRKLVLMPREHAKTALVAGALPAHILIQPAESNIYFPGMAGSECRILLSGETETMAKKNLRVVREGIFQGNQLFRALWPEVVWESPKRQAAEWSANAIIIPRKNEWPDPTIRAIGVGGAVTGARPNILIKDDLVSFAAANSETIMQEAIEWHIASRALLETYENESGLQALEFIIGTRWAVYDLYSYIIDNDPSVEVVDDRFWRIIDDDKILWPEKYTKKDIEQLRREHGSSFFLLYMNSAADPELTDFDLEKVRGFRITKGNIVFEEDERDELLARRVEVRRQSPEEKPAPEVRGMKLNDALEAFSGRREFLRLKYG